MCSSIKAYKKALKNNALTVVQTIDYLAGSISLNRACRVFNITTQKYYRLKNKVMCTASVLNLCFKTHPGQLTIAECTIIKTAINEAHNSHKSLTTIWYQLMRSNSLFCASSTFYKYASLLSVQVLKTKHIPAKLQLRATRIFEYLHIDTTLVPSLQQGMLRGVIIKDNYSKKILHQAVVNDGSSGAILAVVKEMFTLCNLQNHPQPITLVSDGGSENKGEVTQWFTTLDASTFTKQIAKTPTFSFTNNQIESTFNTFKNKFLNQRAISNKVHLLQELNDFAHYNNNHRYPISLAGYTPQEVFEGAIVDKNKFKISIQQAQTLRYHKNKSASFCNVCTM